MLSLLGSLRRGNFVQRSLRFRSSASAYLNRTPATSGSLTAWTMSMWVKRGSLGVLQNLFGALTGAGATTEISFLANDSLAFIWNTSNYIQTSAVFRDPSAWYHVVAVWDSNNATAADRAIIYINSVRQVVTLGGSYPTLGQQSFWNRNLLNTVGRFNAVAYFDGYLTEVNFIDGQALTPSSFGQIESTTGVWSPKQYAGSYGTNGFYLKFGNTSSVAALGTDSSGNGNTWTVNNVSLTAGATYDSMLDVPVNYSDGGNGRGNYAVLNPLAVGAVGTTTTPQANLSLIGNNTIRGVSSFEIPTSGNWYFEIQDISYGTGGAAYVGIGTTASQLSTAYCIYQTDGTRNITGSSAAYGATWGAAGPSSDVIGVAVDSSAGTVTFYKNNISQGAITHGLGTTLYGILGKTGVNLGVIYANFGQRPFTYTPPTGFRALNTNNLPTPSIVNGANFMAATTYTGNAAARSLSNAVNNVSFQPDLVWIKSRTPGATSHALFDSSRGVTKYLSSNTTTAETTLAQSLTALNSDGFSLGTDTTLVNASANSYVAWQWRESITAGLDIVTYTGNGANRTIAHNLGVAPVMVIVKRYDAPNTGNWQVRHTSIAAANSIQLNATSAAAAAATVWNSTAPTSSVFSVGTSTDVNATGGTYAAYCFAEIAGFSKFGSYTGNGSADGPFVFCGFRPRFVLMKNSTSGVAPWTMYDSSRDSSNPETALIQPNSANTEVSSVFCDFTANGFKIRQTGNSYNETGQTYIFAAFAEVPSKYALAR
jgi:hypothetical protein